MLWRSPRHRRIPTPSSIRRSMRRLLLDTLEDRVVPAQVVDLGPLRFSADLFNVVNNTYTASDQVTVGLTPTGNETFTPLITINPLQGGSVSFTVGTPDPKFTVTDATFTSIVQGVPTLDIWKTTGAFTFDAVALTSSGVPLNSGGQPFATNEGQFTLNNLRFADPTGGDTTDAQIKLQGILGSVPTLIGLSMSVTGSNFLILDSAGLTLTGVSEAVSGGLSVGGLGFDVSNLSVSFSNGQFSLTGSTSFQLENESVTANFAGPGLVVQNGIIQDFDLALTSNINLAGVSFTTNNLRVNYTQSTSTYTVTGSASLTVAGQSLTVNFGGGGTNGLTIASGSLTNLDVQVIGKFKLLELEFQAGTQANPLTLTYTQSPETIFTLGGEVSVPELFGATVILGSQTQKGIVIKDGHFQLEDVTVELSDVNLGAFTLDQLIVNFNQGLMVTVDVWFPEGWKLGGIVGLTEEGKLNTIGFSIQGNEGIEIADTGITITGLSGEMQNLQHPAELIVSGSLTANWGTNALIEVTGGFQVDKDELILDGNVSILDGYGKGSGRVVLDWGQQDYSIEVKLSWLDGVITGDVVLDLRDQDNLYVKATADVNVPDAIPVIGGKTLADINFVVEWHSDPNQESFIAAWVDAHFLFISVDIGVKYAFEKHATPKVIGAHEIHNLDQPQPVNPQDQVYQYDLTFTIPQSPSDPVPTNGLIHVRWPQGGGSQSIAITYPDQTTYKQSDFSEANGITLMQQYSTGQQYVLGLVGSHSDPYQALPKGTYVVHLTSNLQFDTSDPNYKMLLSSFGFSRPSLKTPLLSTDTSNLLIPITLSGHADSSLQPRVTLYYDEDNEGYDGTLIPGAVNLEVKPGSDGSWSLSQIWNTSGLLPVSYYVYASITDGVNGPVHSAYSTAVIPSPQLWGNVVNLEYNHAPLGGITVYLDRNNDGLFTPNVDVYTSTNDKGVYTFNSHQLPSTAGMIYVGVVIPQGFQLHPGTENPQQLYFDPSTNPTLVADFFLDEFRAIHGKVYADFALPREPLPSKVPLQGWTVYLDANNNGFLDAGEQRMVTGVDGSYAFHNVPPNSTQTVRFLLQPGYYLTGSTPDSYVVQVGSGEFTIYDNNDLAVMAFSTVSGNVSGYALQDGVLNTNTTPLQGWTVQLTSGVALDAGGVAAGNYQADQAFTNGQVAPAFPNPINTTYVSNPAPQQVYQTNRYGSDFGYTLSGLTPGTPYEVRLHFAETFWDNPGDRLFRVDLNGQTVLDQFDIFAAAQQASNSSNGKGIAVVRTFTATADATGAILLHFQGQTDNAQVNGIEVFASPSGTAIDSGGGASGPYQADEGFSGGEVASTSHAIFTGAVSNPAPEEVYQTNRNGASFAYSLTGLIPHALYVVRLHFAETELDGPNERLFQVAINGVTVLDQFDIFAAADTANNGGGGKFVAIALPFGVIADHTGTINLQFIGQTYHAQINGIELLGGTHTTTTDATGNYTFENLFSGSYTISQMVPPNWRQISPFSSDLVLQTPQGHDILPFPGQGGTPSAIAVADFNGDGKPDFAVLDPNQSQVFIYYNGNFANPQGFDVDNDPISPIAIVASDFAQTGRQSIGIIGAFGGFSILRNDGSGRFTQTDWYPLDLPFTAFTASVLGQVVGQFAPGNGWPQLAVLATGPSGNVQTTAVNAAYYIGSGEGATTLYLDSINTPTGMTGGDMNGDGWTDLMVTFQNQAPILLYGGTNPANQQGQSITGLPAGSMPVMADINGDGLLDVGLFDSNAVFHYAIQDQAGGFTIYNTTVGPPDTTLNAAMLQDVNGDLKPDLIFLSDGNGPNQALFVVVNSNSVASWFTRSQQTSWSLATSAQGGLAVGGGDLDGNGLNDLIVLDTNAGSTQIVRNHSVTSSPSLLATVQGSNSSSNNFRNAQIGQMNGRVFDDFTRDGVSLPFKPGRAGVTVYLDLNRNGRLDLNEPHVVTGSDGYYAFSGLAPDTYQIRYIDDSSRRTTSPEGGVHQVNVSDLSQMISGLDFGNTVGLQVVLTMPTGGKDWTVVRNRDRLEVLDRSLGVIYSHPLHEVYSLTVQGTNRGSDRLTVNLNLGGFFTLPGGIQFHGGTGAGYDSLRIVLGASNDTLALASSRVTINQGLRVHWTGLELINLHGGAGDDTYLLATRNAHVRIHDTAGTDTLDFSAAISGVRIDLSKARGQVQHTGVGNRFSLYGLFENVLGSAYNDVLIGNGANNVLQGGAGADILRGLGSDDVLLGGPGADLLFGGAGRDLLLGGTGVDLLFGDQSDDILIGSRTTLDTDTEALQALMAEWTSRRSYEVRIQNLMDGTGSSERANGEVFLTSNTVKDDRAIDILFGGTGRDWFWRFPLDVLADRRANERITR